MYSWKENCRIKADAEVAGRVCEELEAKGNLTPDALLDASRAEDAPLHNVFEWDDSVAAEKYRRDQAAHIIRSIVIKRAEVKDEPVRAFIHIKESSTPKYEKLDVVLQSSDKRKEMLETAKKELRMFKAKYSTLTELAKVIADIEDVLDKK